MKSSEFEKWRGLYNKLTDAIGESEDYHFTGRGCFMAGFEFNIDFVNEEGDRFYLTCSLDEYIDNDN